MPTVSGFVVSTGSESSGRRMFSEVIDELARPINVGDSTIRALAADSFRAAVRKMNTKGMWPWEILDEDIAIMANEKFSTVSGPIKKPLAMHYTNGIGGNPDEPLQYVSYDRFCEIYTLDVAGQAHTYTIPNLFETGQIRWFPVPNANDTARLNYFRATPAPRLEQETIEIPDYVIESYMSIAWYELLKRLPNEQRPFPIVIAQADAKEAFRTLSAHVASPGDRSRAVC